MSDRATTSTWARLLTRAPDIAVNSTRALRVSFADGRSHRLRIDDADDHWLLTGIILKDCTQLPAESPFHHQPALAAAMRNRRLTLCALTVDEQRRLIGICQVPKAGLTAAEFQLCARHLAAECDRLEHLLTGTDRE